MSMYMGWGRGKKEEGKERHLHNITVISQLSSNPFNILRTGVRYIRTLIST